MARSPRDRFEAQRDKISRIDDENVRAALHGFADALDPEFNHAAIPKPKSDGSVTRSNASNSTAKGYLSALRTAHSRGLNLLTDDADAVNNFMRDLVTEPDRRRYDVVDYDGSMTKPSARANQSALRAFYRFCTDPMARDDRPDVSVEWPGDEIIMFTEKSEPKHDEDDMPQESDLDAMREACLQSQNTRRDRAFVELAAGTGQRVYALVTLRIKHVNLDGDAGPHILLNPEIRGDGDKGAIAATGRMKPIVSDTGPIRQWIDHHPLRDADAREKYDAPESFGDCYLFIGSLRQRSTDPADRWSEDGARNMLNRRKADTESMHGVDEVTIPVNPHNWRHFAYTKSQDLPMDESTRRKVFGWAPGSDTGQTIYGHKTNEKAVREFAEAWADEFAESDGDAETVIEQVTGEAVGGSLSPEARAALAREIIGDDEAIQEIADAIDAA